MHGHMNVKFMLRTIEYTNIGRLFQENLYFNNTYPY